MVSEFNELKNHLAFIVNDELEDDIDELEEVILLDDMDELEEVILLDDIIELEDDISDEEIGKSHKLASKPPE